MSRDYEGATVPWDVDLERAKRSDREWNSKPKGVKPMGKLVIMRPLQAAKIIEFENDVVELEDLYRLLECETVDTRTLNRIPGSTRWADIWVDDEGLLDARVPANRELPGGDIIAGTILCCAHDNLGNSLSFTDEEAAVILAHVETWRVLPEGHPKPEPAFEIITK